MHAESHVICNISVLIFDVVRIEDNGVNYRSCCPAIMLPTEQRESRTNAEVCPFFGIGKCGSRRFHLGHGIWSSTVVAIFRQAAPEHWDVAA